MTIAVTIRTGSAVVFAADSRVTTKPDLATATPPAEGWQAYDHAVKLAQDRSARLMAMVVGHSRIGDVDAVDVISAYNFPKCLTDKEQIAALKDFVLTIYDKNKQFWKSRNPAVTAWHGPLILFALSGVSDPRPRVWSTSLEVGYENMSRADIYPVDERLRLDGSPDHTTTLLQGFSKGALTSIAEKAQAEEGPLLAAAQALHSESSPRLPWWQLSLDHMPAQDAVDLAVFLAEVQISMERFLPDVGSKDSGTSRGCGGAIDVMVLRSDLTTVVSLPGKTLHHPRIRATVESGGG